eukprot:g36155.t1
MPYGLSAAPNNTHHEVRVSPSGARSDGVPLKLLPPRGYRRREPSVRNATVEGVNAWGKARQRSKALARHWDRLKPLSNVRSSCVPVRQPRRSEDREETKPR